MRTKLPSITNCMVVVCFLITSCISVLRVTAAEIKCTTVSECAERIEQLQEEIDNIKSLKDQDGLIKSNMVILAVAVVQHQELMVGSPGVVFREGRILYPNPSRLIAIPLITDAQEECYITNHQWIADQGEGFFVVKSHAMDTGGPSRTFAATDFTAVVIGLRQ